MPLVEYSDDDSEESTIAPVSKKQKISREHLPPLPTAFQDLYACSVRTSKTDDPELHGGRQRVTPHVDGHWPTHVYAEWVPSEIQRKSINQLIESHSAEAHKVTSFLLTELGTPAPLHVSLSRSLSLQTYQKHDFAQALEISVENADIEAFETIVSSLDWVSNFSKTRWFLILRLKQPESGQLDRLLEAANTVATAYSLPGLYLRTESVHSGNTVVQVPPAPGEIDVDDFQSKEAEASTSCPFHVSIAWSLTKPSSKPSQEHLRLEQEELFSKIRVPVNAVKVKIGNTISTFALRSAR